MPRKTKAHVLTEDEHGSPMEDEDFPVYWISPRIFMLMDRTGQHRFDPLHYLFGSCLNLLDTGLPCQTSVVADLFMHYLFITSLAHTRPTQTRVSPAIL